MTNRVTKGEASAGSFTATGKTGATLATRLAGRLATGTPATGTWRAGDIVSTTDGSLAVCTVAGTPGTWVAGALGASATATTLAVSGVTTLSGPEVWTPNVVAALALDVTLSGVYTKSIALDSTFTASAAGTAGQRITLIIATDGTQRVVTFGTNLNSSGTLTIPANKIGTWSGISDGTAFRETGRAICL